MRFVRALMAKDCTSMATAGPMAAFRRFVLEKKKPLHKDFKLKNLQMSFGKKICTSLVCPTAFQTSDVKDVKIHKPFAEPWNCCNLLSQSWKLPRFPMVVDVHTDLIWLVPPFCIHRRSWRSSRGFICDGISKNILHACCTTLYANLALAEKLPWILEIYRNHLEIPLQLPITNPQPSVSEPPWSSSVAMRLHIPQHSTSSLHQPQTWVLEWSKGLTVAIFFWRKNKI